MNDALTKLVILRMMLRSTYDEWRQTVWKKDLDGLWCCDGRECCCGGMTRREAFKVS
jgi:hypothetical protein